MTDDFPDWQKAVMAFTGGASEMTDDYPDWVMGVAVEAGSQVGGSQLIGVKTTSQYYVAKTATLYYATAPNIYEWWSECTRATVGYGVVTDYLTLDISSLTSGMATPILIAHFQFYTYGLETGSCVAYGEPAICKNDNTVIVEDILSFTSNSKSEVRASSLIADITTEKANQIKIRFKERSNWFGSGFGMTTGLKMFPFIELFDAKL